MNDGIIWDRPLPVLDTENEPIPGQTRFVRIQHEGGYGLRIIHDPLDDDSDILLELTPDGMRLIFTPAGFDSVASVTMSGKKLEIVTDTEVYTHVPIVINNEQITGPPCEPTA